MSAIPIPPRALRQLIVDTTIATPSSGHFLRYNGTKWVNVALVVGDIPSLAGTYQPLDADLTSWAAVTRGSGFDTFAATPSSANLRSLVSDETGTGALVFAGGNIGAATGTSLALGGATIGSNALAVTGTAAISSTISNSSLFYSNPGALQFKFRSDAIICFANGSDPVFNPVDTTLSRNSAGVLQFGTTTSNASGSWTATNGTLSGTLAVTGASTFSSRINLASYTVATLPAAGVAGGAVYVSDAGGNGPCLAISNGTNWKRCDNTGTTVS